MVRYSRSTVEQYWPLGPIPIPLQYTPKTAFPIPIQYQLKLVIFVYETLIIECLDIEELGKWVLD